MRGRIEADKLDNKLPIGEIVADLKDNLGIRLTAVIGQVKSARTLKRWENGQQRPSLERQQILRDAYHITHLLKSSEDSETIRAWFIGMQPELGDKSPALMLKENNTEVFSAALAFLSD